MPRLALCVLVYAAAGCAPHLAAVGAAGGLPIASATGRWSNVYVITKPDAAVVIDTGSPPDCEALDAALAALPPIRAVVVTHAHGDHAGCARHLQQRGAAVILGAGDVPAAARGTNEPLRPTGLLAALGAPVFMFPFEPFTPDVAVAAPQDLGAYGFPEVRVALAAGHTPGELAVRLGDSAFVGDLLKGEQLRPHTPTEHLYQSDRAADHAAIAALLGATDAPTALYPGHGGRLDAADVRGWLAGADLAGADGVVALELDARAELPGGGTGGLRARLALGGAVAYVVGADVRAGDVAGAELAVDAYPLGLAWRGSGGALLSLAAGAGVGGTRGLGATRAIAELAAELPVAGARLLARGGLGYRLGGARYGGDVGGLADEATALVGVRVGGDRDWGDYRAGHGPFLAATWSDLGGVQRYGVALGVELASEKRR